MNPNARQDAVLELDSTRVLAERPEISVTARNTKISSAVPIPYAAGTGAQLLIVLVAAALRFGHFTRDVGLLSEGRRCTALGPLIVALPLSPLALVDRAFALVGTVFAFVGHLFAFVGDGVALIGDLVPVVGTPRTACDLASRPATAFSRPSRSAARLSRPSDPAPVSSSAATTHRKPRAQTILHNHGRTNGSTHDAEPFSLLEKRDTRQGATPPLRSPRSRCLIST